MNKKPKEIWRFTKTCPKCDGKNLMFAIKGYPSPEGMRLIEEGKAFPGGCSPLPGMPDCECKDCGFEWCNTKNDQKLHEETLKWFLTTEEGKQIYEKDDRSGKLRKQDEKNHKWLEEHYKSLHGTMG